MGDLDVETSKNVCNSFGKTFGVGEDNKATMVDTIYFLLSTQLAAIVNEVSRVVVSGEGFRYSLSFPWYFLLGGRNVPRAIHKSASDRVFMLGMVVWFEIKVTVGVGSFPVDRYGGRAIFLSGCFGVKKGNRTFWFYLDYKDSSYEQRLSSEFIAAVVAQKDRGAVCLHLLGRRFFFHVVYMCQGHGRSQPASQLRARKNNGNV